MKNTKHIMVASAVFTALLGLGASFFPDNILEFLDIPVTSQGVVIIQCLSALYLGFAMMNWMSRAAIIGGIYGRPLTTGNFFHFSVGSISLVKHFALVQHNLVLIAVSLGYIVFAVLFGRMMMKHPASPTAS
jgi:hypothetical protein